MKHFILVSLLLSSVYLFSQDVEVNWTGDYSKTYNGDTVWAGSTSDIIYTDLHVVNKGSSESFIWQRKIISHSSQGFSDELCDDQLCHIPSGIMWTCQVPMPVSNGDSTLFQPKLLTNGSAGSGHHRYYILDQDEVMLDSVDVIFNSTLNTNEEKLSDKDFLVYPNPSNGEVNFILNLDSNKSVYELKLKDALGKVVYESTLKTNENKKITNLNKGIYFAVIHSDSKNDVVTKKFIVR